MALLSTPTTTLSSLSLASLTVSCRCSACVVLDNAISRLAFSHTFFRSKMSSARPGLYQWPEQTSVTNIQTPLPAPTDAHGRSTRRRRRDTFKDYLITPRQVIADQQEIRTSSFFLSWALLFIPYRGCKNPVPIALWK